MSEIEENAEWIAGCFEAEGDLCDVLMHGIDEERIKDEQLRVLFEDAADMFDKLMYLEDNIWARLEELGQSRDW